MSEPIAEDTQKIDVKSNTLTGGMSAIREAVLSATTEAVIVQGKSVPIFTLFGGGCGGNLGLLKQRTPVPQFDGRVRFDDSFDPVTNDERHDYYVVEEYGERKFNGSCTGVIEACFPQFDGSAAYDGMLRKGRISDPNDKYYNKTKQEVLDEWNGTGLAARTHGKNMHKQIECFFNNCVDPTNVEWESADNKPALDRFLRCWRQEFVGKLVPVRTEMIMFDKRFEFAGQADIVYRRVEWLDDPEKCNWIGVGDWKRSKKNFANEVAYEKGLGPCAELDNTSLSKYRLQMSMYASCLMRQTNYVVKEMHLGIFHAAHPDYCWIRVEPLYEIADRMLLERRQKSIQKYMSNLLRLSTRLATSFAVSATEPSQVAYGTELDGVMELLVDTRNLKGMIDSIWQYGASADEILGVAKRKRSQ